MIKQYVYINQYDWHVTIIYNANRDLSAVAEELWYAECPSYIARHALSKVIVKKNSGICFTNDKLHASIICVTEADSAYELINTIVHEIKHLQSHICSYYGISEKGEEAAYLSGNIVEEFYEVFRYELDKFEKWHCYSNKN